MADQLFTNLGPVRPTNGTKPQRPPKPCGYPGCPNQARKVQAGKYCEEHATMVRGVLAHEYTQPQAGTCIICATPSGSRTIVRGRPLIVCLDHAHLRSKIRGIRQRHNAPDHWITEALNHPTCWICERDMAWMFNPRGARTTLTQVHVDHNRDCCSGDTSCGDCIRGLAHAHCNRQLGHLEAFALTLGWATLRHLIDKLDPPKK